MNQTVHYRIATVSDCRKLSVLFQTVYIQTYGVEGVSDEFANFITSQFSIGRLEKLIADQPENLIVAEYNQNLVGVLEIVWDKKSPVGEVTGPELNKLYILERFCGHGIGQALLARAEESVRRKSQNLFWLWVLESNERAVRFYEKHGYRLIGHAAFQMEKNRYMNKVMVKYF